MTLIGRKAMLALTAVLAAVGCSTSAKDLPVSTDYSKTTAFHEWKTFRFASGDAETTTGARYPRYEQMLKEAIVDELTARGYTRIEDGTPDFRIAFDLVFKGKAPQQGVPNGGGADPMARSYSGSTPTGSLTIKMLDPKTLEPLWTGVLSDLKVTAIEPQKQLNNAVWRVLVEFPPITG